MRSLEREIGHAERDAFGFFGTIRVHAEPDEGWSLATAAIGNATGCSDEAVRAFLESRYGRHFAGEVVDILLSGQELAAAIDRAIERWMTRRSDAQIEEEVGIPPGFPYLTGLVCMHEALLETSA